MKPLPSPNIRPQPRHVKGEGTDGEDDEVFGQNVHGVLGAAHARLHQGEPRVHPEDQEGRDQDPQGVGDDLAVGEALFDRGQLLGESVGGRRSTVAEATVASSALINEGRKPPLKARNARRPPPLKQRLIRDNMTSS
jgi:hypothetical protein